MCRTAGNQLRDSYGNQLSTVNTPGCVSHDPNPTTSSYSGFAGNHVRQQYEGAVQAGAQLFKPETATGNQYSSKKVSKANNRLRSMDACIIFSAENSVIKSRNFMTNILRYSRLSYLCRLLFTTYRALGIKRGKLLQSIFQAGFVAARSDKKKRRKYSKGQKVQIFL